MTAMEQRIAARMKIARQLAGISQEEAGRRLNVTLRTYARWERGETAGFMGHIGEIAAALDTSPDELLGGEVNSLAPEDLSKKLDQILSEIQRLRKELGR